MKYISGSLNETKEIAQKFSLLIKTKPLLLFGEMGAGKTTLVKFIAQELGVNENVTSPTFNKMKIYNNLIHIDAYNMNGSLEKFEDYFGNKPIAIEWSNNISHDFEHYIRVKVYLENNKHIYEIIEDK